MDAFNKNKGTHSIPQAMKSMLLITSSYIEKFVKVDVVHVLVTTRLFIFKHGIFAFRVYKCDLLYIISDYY